jgi:hypothetical protein
MTSADISNSDEKCKYQKLINPLPFTLLCKGRKINSKMPILHEGKKNIFLRGNATFNRAGIMYH